jgi:hypothetical protein
MSSPPTRLVNSDGRIYVRQLSGDYEPQSFSDSPPTSQPIRNGLDQVIKGTDGRQLYELEPSHGPAPSYGSPAAAYTIPGAGPYGSSPAGAYMLPGMGGGTSPAGSYMINPQ